MKTLSKWLLMVSVVAFCWQINAVQLKAGYPEVYTVKAKDTLWSIAGKYLKNPWQWSSLWQCNPQVHNPHLIYPGDILRVTIEQGRACLQRETGIVKLSPQMRIEPGKSPIPPIPMKMVEPFLTKNRVMSLQQFLAAPYVLAHQGAHLMSTEGNQIYARGLRNKHIVHYAVLHREAAYLNPVTKKSLGIEAAYVASAAVETFGDPATLRVVAVRGVINEGDRLFPVENRKKLSQFIPHSPAKPVEARIIGVLRSISQVGRFNVVALNYGKADGARPGQVLDILRAGKIVQDKYSSSNKNILLPNTKIGVLMVFKTFQQVSYALIMQASQEVRVLDKVQSAR